MKEPRRGKPIQPRTLAMCAEFDRRKAEGEDERDIVGDLKERFGIQRAAVWKALRSGGSVPPYQPSEASLARMAEIGDSIRSGEFRPDISLNRVRRERQAAENLVAAPAEPCSRCGVRADVGCRHRPAAGDPPPAIAEPQRKAEKRHRKPGGLNFHRDQIAENLHRGADLLGLRRLRDGDDQA